MRGRVERAVAAVIAYRTLERERARRPLEEDFPLHVSIDEVTNLAFCPTPASDAFVWSWAPSRDQRRSAARAMRGFVRKDSRYALVCGLGSDDLCLYDPCDKAGYEEARMFAHCRRRKRSRGRVAEYREL